jgi:hypothetical protein
VGLACESASVRQMARQFGLIASTVLAIDLRYLQRWSAVRRKDPRYKWVRMRFTLPSRYSLCLHWNLSRYVYYMLNITRREDKRLI